MKRIIITQAIMEMVVVMLMTTRRIRMTMPMVEMETMPMEMITMPMMATTRIKKEIKIIRTRKEGTKIKINKVVERARRVSRTKINLRKIHQKIWRQVSLNFDTVMIAIREIL